MAGRKGTHMGRRTLRLMRLNRLLRRRTHAGTSRRERIRRLEAGIRCTRI